ncbi:16S rRNA (cytidine(1402)-2'-O)-methyltransferase [Chelatococcus sambhunathii]|uniref:Ribosomal RNA small subunit methyltransferase I n=1 Tax=Chelatococcus sambhunathii TaxID=363953 RepID=A0ABU1DKA7_9HYPH|nr:16S rRNA (cytidine(1402)-2'-O)-methyltransferase [Chelatococcus sambhunathii]
MPRPEPAIPSSDTSSAAVTDRARGYVLAGQRMTAGPLAPGLHVVATPIGTLADITLRALETLAGADLILCEDTRVTRKLTSHYGISTPLAAYHEHNAAEMRPVVLEKLAAGGRLALVSDAGTPLVSDPGFKLVRDAIAAGAAVTSAPGASAVLTALVLSGLPTDRFFFEGFLPAKAQARAARIAELSRLPATLVLFESGPRLAASLADLVAGLGDRPAAVARELTKRFEEVRRASLPELAAALASEAAPKGEIALVVGPPPEEETLPETDLDAALTAALARVSVKDAVAEVAASTGVPRREVYARALDLAKAR